LSRAGTIAAVLFATLLSALPGRANETVHIAFQTDFAPFVYVKDGKPEGLIVDILNAAAARESIAISYVPVPFAQLDGTLTDGKADAITPLAVTPDRKSIYDIKAGLNWARLRRDMNDPAIEARIEANKKIAGDLNIEGTPTLVIGQKIIEGADMPTITAAVANARHDRSRDQSKAVTPMSTAAH
jgi:hypothetical protein